MNFIVDLIFAKEETNDIAVDGQGPRNLGPPVVILVLHVGRVLKVAPDGFDVVVIQLLLVLLSLNIPQVFPLSFLRGGSALRGHPVLFL